MASDSMRAAGLLLLAWTSALLGGCGDDVQGNLRLLITPPHAGRNPVQDPFELVDRVEVGLVDGSIDFTSLGNFAPLARFGPGLVGGGKEGFPFVIGFSQLGKPVAQGFGPFMTLSSGLEYWLSIPFSQIDVAVARKIPATDSGLADPFFGKPPALFMDQRHLERGVIDSAADLSSLVTILWHRSELLLKVRVRDDQLSPGDAVKVYLDQMAVTAGVDGTVEPLGIPCELEETDGGYLVRLRLPLLVSAKNLAVPFDLRIYDKDGDEEEAVATWSFDSQLPEEELLPDEYGSLILGVPLLDLLHHPGPVLDFPGTDGLVSVAGSWDQVGLRLEVNVPDDEVLTSTGGNGDLQGADRVEFFLDLANDLPPTLEPERFVRITATGGGSESHAAGSDPEKLTPEALVFTGEVQGTVLKGGYRVGLVLPWEDLRLAAVAPQRGWYLGLEVRVIDQDATGVTTSAWSDAAELDPSLWPELRLFSVE